MTEMLDPISGNIMAVGDGVIIVSVGYHIENIKDLYR